LGLDEDYNVDSTVAMNVEQKCRSGRGEILEGRYGWEID